jgi:hypothetical protein
MKGPGFTYGVKPGWMHPSPERAFEKSNKITMNPCKVRGQQIFIPINSAH